MTRTAANLQPATAPAAASSLPSFWPVLDRAIDARQSELVQLRRRIHAAPEASGEELATTALVAQQLQAAGIKPRIMAGNVGLIADIDLGAPPDACVALRAELDCVKVDDDKQSEYASTRAGLCHACGHDAHTTMVLGAALAVHQNGASLRNSSLKRNLRIIFQPAEESATGALSMIQQGALTNVQAIMAVHVEPFIEAGIIGLRKGPLTSACKTFRILIKGRSGHSARPFQAVDPIPAAVSITDLFYQLGPRSMDSRYPLALTVASISAGSSFNAIPDEAEMRGTLRTARIEDLAAVERKMEAIVAGVSVATGCEVTMDFPQYAPATNNDPAIIDTMAAAATDLLGVEGVQWLDVPSLGAEDFAFFQEKIPGAIVRLGAALPDPKQRRPLHSSMFDIDERALAIGAKFLARSALMAAANL